MKHWFSKRELIKVSAGEIVLTEKQQKEILNQFKDYWYTLAYSELGTHKMKLKEKMVKKEAENSGETYCKENNLTYVGTYEKEEVEYRENKLRLDLYF